jgi:hypothetical protein
MDDDFMCDEEKSYNEWVSHNLTFLSKHRQFIQYMKKIYMDGFAAGYVHRDRINAQAQLQK